MFITLYSLIEPKREVWKSVVHFMPTVTPFFTDFAAFVKTTK